MDDEEENRKGISPDNDNTSCTEEVYPVRDEQSVNQGKVLIMKSFLSFEL
jgi:hypothetical protein